VGGRRFRIYYATQTSTRPFRIKIFCNREEKLTEQYRRYLEAGLVEEFGLDGCPVYFDLVGKERDKEGDRVMNERAFKGKPRKSAPSKIESGEDDAFENRTGLIDD